MKNFKKIAVVVLGLFIFSVPILALAGSKMSDNVYIAEDEIVEGNLIKAGGIIEINGAVNGDVIVAGSSVTINGAVAGDVIAAGSSVRVLGPVGGSVRVAASIIEVGGEVERNVWAVGSSVLISENASVAWDVYAAGATVEIKSPVAGNIWLAGQNIILDNEVSQNAKVSLDETGSLILGEATTISGSLDYNANSENQLTVREGAQVVGTTTFNHLDLQTGFNADKAFDKFYIFFQIIALFSLLVVGLLFIGLVPKLLLNIHDQMLKKPWPSIGWGVIFLLLTPIISFLLMLTVIGLPLGLILIPIYLITLYFAKVFAGFTLGLWLMNKMSKDKKYKGSLVLPLVLGLLIFIILTGIPVIGFIIKVILVLWALGALFSVKREFIKEYR